MRSLWIEASGFLSTYRLVIELRFDAILYFWAMKNLMRAISNVHAGHRFPSPGLAVGLYDQVMSQNGQKTTSLMTSLTN